MASPTLALDSTMVFTLPSNASQALYPDNTVTDFRVALPERVALRSNDYEVALASFTYARSWYVPDLAGQTHMATFTFLAGHLYPPLRDGGRAEEETTTAETEGTAEMPPSHPCQGSMFIKSRRTLSPGNYEHVRQMLHDLDWHGGGSRMGFQFSYNAVQDRVLVAFRPVCYEPQRLDWLPMLPVLRAGVHMASDVLRGKTMKQAFKNRVAPLVGDLVQAATAQPARKRATPPRRSLAKRPRQGDIFAW